MDGSLRWHDPAEAGRLEGLRDQKKLLMQQMGMLDAKLGKVSELMEMKKSKKRLAKMARECRVESGSASAGALQSHTGGGGGDSGVVPWRAAELKRQVNDRTRVPPLVAPQCAKPACAGASLQHLRVRDALRKVDGHLYQLALPPLITDSKGWVLRERPSEHQINDRSRSNPVLSSALMAANA